jgi:hypothetical protein
MRRRDHEPRRRTRPKRHEVAELDIEKRLAAFATHKQNLVTMLREAYGAGRQNEAPFNEERAWQQLQVSAWQYFQSEARLNEKLLEMPAAERIKLLRQLGDALSRARRKADETVPVVHGRLFVEWCVANGDPDFSDPIIEHYGAAFDEMVDKMVAGLAALEKAAFSAAASIPKRRGPPSGTAALPHDFILLLESLYRVSTDREAGAGPGPFARFAKEVATALGRDLPLQSVIEAIKDAKRREESRGAASRWGPDYLVNLLGGKFPSRP